MQRVQDAFLPHGPDGNAITRADGWVGPVTSMFTDWRTCAPSAVQVVDSAVDTAGSMASDHVDRPPDQELDRDSTGIGEPTMSTSGMAHYETAYQVLAYDGTGQVPPLPEGHGAVALFTWCGPVARKYTVGPMMGVDGKPATFGPGPVP